MSWSWLARSLQAKLLAAIAVCALIPLAGVGMWLSSSAVRSGEQLLRTQLDSAAAHAASIIQQRWAIRRSDVLMLSTSAPVRAALVPPAADTVPSYARRAFATMTGIARITLRDSAGRTRWSLGEAVPLGTTSRRTDLDAESVSSTIFRARVMDDEARPLGMVEALIRLDGLGPLSTIDVAPSQFVAYRDRDSGAQIAPRGVPAAAFTDEYFEWHEHRWLTVRRHLDEPSIDIVAAAQLGPFLSPFARTARTGAAALAFAAAVVVVLTIIVTRRLTSSLGDLALAADRVSRGQFDARVEDSSPDEVGRVGRAFNTMLDSISRMMRELSQREAVAAMGELAATMAHQVRSPATAMRLDIQRAHDKLPPDSPERALLLRALGQLDRLERAVSASLKVARGGRSDLSELDVWQSLEPAVAGIRRENPQVTVETFLSPGSLRVLGDASSLEQLFGNVLANAAQASREGGRVWVSVEPKGSSELTITIRDEGRGMTPDVLARAGEPLFSTKPEGTGLGLAIARRIAVAHGGTISIESANGSGTTVAIRLPRR